MKLLNSQPLANGSVSFYLPRGQYGAIQIEYMPVAHAAITLTRANYGSVIVNWNGQDVINVDAEFLNLVNDVYGGTAEFDPNVAALSRMSLFIPTGYWFDPRNVYDIGANDKVLIKLDLGDLSNGAYVDSGNVNIYAKEKVGVMNYLHNIITQPITSAGGGQQADRVIFNNIAGCYFKDPATLLTSIQLSKDGNTIVDGTPANLIAYSDYIHRLETTNTMLSIDFVESLDIREAVGSDLRYKLTFSGAGTQYLYISFIDFTPDKAVESQRIAVNKLSPVVQLTTQQQQATGLKSTSPLVAESIRKASSVGSVGGRY